jgi:hypothetical protein
MPLLDLAAGNNGPNAGTVENALPWVTTVAMTTHSRNMRESVRLLGRLFTGDNYFLGGMYDSASALTVLGDDAAVSKAKVSSARRCRRDALSTWTIKGKVVVSVVVSLYVNVGLNRLLLACNTHLDTRRACQFLHSLRRNWVMCEILGNPMIFMLSCAGV